MATLPLLDLREVSELAVSPSGCRLAPDPEGWVANFVKKPRLGVPGLVAFPRASMENCLQGLRHLERERERESERESKREREREREREEREERREKREKRERERERERETEKPVAICASACAWLRQAFLQIPRQVADGWPKQREFMRGCILASCQGMSM